ncbi:MAG: hypothetical protein S4CHLAM123_03590 [Chlamydiales bacterium]|nr:hypothetical protein [Chlamydiales bacterium]
MSPYLFTLTFLFMMSFLTSSQVNQFKQNTLEMRLYQQSRLTFAQKEELRELSHLEEFRASTEATTQERKKAKPIATKCTSTAKHSTPLCFNTARPPNNSRLNIYLLLHGERTRNTPKEFALEETLANLMRNLYQEAPFFHQVSNAEERIIEKLIEKKEETLNFDSPDQLSVLSMDDPQLQQVFYQMLKGTAEAPSLLNYITFDRSEERLRGQRRKINLMFVSQELLHAIFPRGTVAADLLQYRDSLWAEIFDQEEHRLERSAEECKNRSQLKQDLHTAFANILESSGYSVNGYKSQVFDFGIGDSGNILFVKDASTGEIVREKYTDVLQRTRYKKHS